MRVALLCFILLLSGCANRAPAPVVDAHPAAPTVTPSTSGNYVVKRGDTVYSIARAHSVSPAELMRWNQLPDARISIGQVLRVSNKEPAVVSSESTTTSVVNPIVTAPAIEAKPLEPVPGEIKTPSAAPATPAANASLLKTEPKGLKLPYTEQNLALLQRNDSAATKTPATASDAPPSTPATAEKPAPEAAAPVDTQAAAVNDGVEWSWPANGNLIGKFVEGGNKGVEIAGRAGDAVYAAAAGKVTYRGSGVRGYGNLVILKHNEKYLSAYAHNKSILVKQGQTVKRGQKIAELGESGTDKPMLHFEIRRFGKPIDPLELLPQRTN